MNRQQYHTLHDSLEHLRTDLIDIHRHLLQVRKSYLNHLTRSYSNRYSAYALEKDSAGRGNPLLQGVCRLNIVLCGFFMCRSPLWRDCVGHLRMGRFLERGFPPHAVLPPNRGKLVVKC